MRLAGSSGRAMPGTQAEYKHLSLLPIPCDVRLRYKMLLPGPPKEPKIMAQYPKIESYRQYIGSIILAILEFQVLGTWGHDIGNDSGSYRKLGCAAGGGADLGQLPGHEAPPPVSRCQHMSIGQNCLYGDCNGLYIGVT